MDPDQAKTASTKKATMLPLRPFASNPPSCRSKIQALAQRPERFTVGSGSSSGAAQRQQKKLSRFGWLREHFDTIIGVVD
jgi:hypothetical protein